MGRSDFKATLTLKTEKEDGNVYYKNDGQRFNNDRTLKLAVDTSYVITLSFRPPLEMNNISIMGTLVTATETARNSDSATFTMHWTSAGINATKKGQRDTVMITAEIKGYGTLTMNLQVKFYKETSNQHCTWGTALHHVDYDCHYNDGTVYVEIDKETIR